MSTKFINSLHTNASLAKATPQSRAIPGREAEMVKNHAGGVTFDLDVWTQLDRFLILGAEGNTYHSSQKELVTNNYAKIQKCIELNAKRVVDRVVEVSQDGRAAKNDPALFVLAAVMKEALLPEERNYARQNVTKVARIGTHILHLAEFVNKLGGWGMGTRKAFSDWFLNKTPDQLAYQFIKYKQRDGWSQRDLLRKAHPFGTPEQNLMFKYITKKGAMTEKEIRELPDQLQGAIEAQKASVSSTGVYNLIKAYKLPWEAVPTEHLNDPKVWTALLPNMGLMAMVRNLGKMTSLGVIGSFDVKLVTDVLTDPTEIKNSRIHPVAFLNALMVYRNGHGGLGKLTWRPSQQIVDALEDGFEKSFNFQTPSGKNTQLALDVSGSMTWHLIPGMQIKPREASAAMALVTAKTEPNYEIVAFSGTMVPLDITAKDSFSSVIQKLGRARPGSTDCSLPMLDAIARKAPVDIFQVYTDNETWCGSMHASQALVKFRKKMNKPNAKLAVVGMESNGFTVADPEDPGMLDFVGFDASAPQAMAAFASM